MDKTTSADTLAASIRRSVRIARRFQDVRAVWGGGRVDPRLREEVMLAVAQAKDCRWCSRAHRRWALAEGVTDAELAALEGLDPSGFDRRTWAAIAWAQARVTGNGRAAPELADELARHYDARERADLDLVVDVMAVANHAANGLAAASTRVQRILSVRETGEAHPPTGPR